MKIAILGTRGIPANYGGFETFAEKISEKLLARENEVAVYGRKRFFEESNNASVNGVSVIKTSTIFHKYLETPLHSLTSFIDVLVFRNFDAIILCNAANSPFSFIAKLKGIPVYTNVDGVERKRKKWNILGRSWYLLGELSSVLFSKKIIADAECIAEYYKETYGVQSAVIAYGAEEIQVDAGEVLKKFNLKKDKYILYVSRLEPENNALGVITAYNNLIEKLLNKNSTDKNIKIEDLKLVIVGDAPYANEYKQNLKTEAFKIHKYKELGVEVVFTGFQFGDAYRELRSNCLLYIQASEIGGTHPALVEALAHGNMIVANDVPEHREVLQDCGAYYPKNDFKELTEILYQIILNSESFSEADIVNLKKRSKQRAKSVYSWDSIADNYMKLLNN